MATRDILVSLPLDSPEIPSENSSFNEMVQVEGINLLTVENPESNLLLARYIPFRFIWERDPDNSGYQVNVHWQNDEKPLPTYTVDADGNQISRSSTDPWHFPDATDTCLMLLRREDPSRVERLSLGAAKLLITNFDPNKTHDWSSTSFDHLVFGLRWKHEIN